jgi:hypothetical protein
LKDLTADWDEREWAISGEYLAAMQKIPQIRDELRAQIESQDNDDYTRKFQYTTLLLDETYRQAQLAEEKRQFGAEMGEKKRVNDAQLEQADAALGIDSYKAGTSRINARTSARNAATRAAQVELNQAREDRQRAKDKASIRQADARIKLAKEKLAWEKKKATGKGSAAQKAEADLALDILKDRDVILGKVDPEFPEEGRKGGMSYTEAYDYVYGLAEAAMPGRNKGYINQWVKARLRAFGYGGAKAAKPRRG